MMEINSYNWKKLFIIISEVALFTLLIIFRERNILYIFLLINFEIIIVNYAWIIRDDLFRGSVWVRHFIYFIPHFISLLLITNLGVVQVSLVYYFLAFCVGISLQFFQFNELKLLFDTEIITLFDPINKKKLQLISFSSISSSILQEIFFKSFIISILIPYTGVTIALLVSSFFFVMEHLLHYNCKKNSLKDYILQFFLSLISGVFYIISGSIIVAIIMHFSYNLPLLVNYIFRYRYMKYKPIN